MNFELDKEYYHIRNELIYKLQYQDDLCLLFSKKEVESGKVLCPVLIQKEAMGSFAEKLVPFDSSLKRSMIVKRIENLENALKDAKAKMFGVQMNIDMIETNLIMERDRLGSFD